MVTPVEKFASEFQIITRQFSWLLRLPLVFQPIHCYHRQFPHMVRDFYLKLKKKKKKLKHMYLLLHKRNSFSNGKISDNLWNLKYYVHSKFQWNESNGTE